MLVLTRKSQQQIRIGNNITISILKIKGNAVSIGIEAPREVRVVRGELSQHSDDPSANVSHLQREPVCSEPESDGPAGEEEAHHRSLRAFLQQRRGEMVCHNAQAS